MQYFHYELYVWCIVCVMYCICDVLYMWCIVNVRYCILCSCFRNEHLPGVLRAAAAASWLHPPSRSIHTAYRWVRPHWIYLYHPYISQIQHPSKSFVQPDQKALFADLKIDTRKVFTLGANGQFPLRQAKETCLIIYALRWVVYSKSIYSDTLYHRYLRECVH